MNQIYYEPMTNLIFTRSDADIWKAAYNLNRMFVFRGYAYLNDFFEYLNLPKNDVFGKFGWDTYLMEIGYGMPWIDVRLQWDEVHHRYTLYFAQEPSNFEEELRRIYE